jgi:hypothetical protein
VRAIATAVLVLNAFRAKGEPAAKIEKLFPHLEFKQTAEQILASLPTPEELAAKLNDCFAATGLPPPVQAPAP